MAVSVDARLTLAYRVLYQAFGRGRSDSHVRQVVVDDASAALDQAHRALRLLADSAMVPRSERMRIDRTLADDLRRRRVLRRIRCGEAYRTGATTHAYDVRIGIDNVTVLPVSGRAGSCCR